jgi:hypothetical protein
MFKRAPVFLTHVRRSIQSDFASGAILPGFAFHQQSFFLGPPPVRPRAYQASTVQINCLPLSVSLGSELILLYIKIAQWSKDWSGPQTISNDVRRRYQSESEMSSAVGVMPLTASRTLVGLNRIAMSSTRRRALSLYKELHRLGRDYPDPKYPFLFMSCIPIRSSSLHTAMISTPACVDCSRVRPIIFKRACHPELRLCPW